MAREGQHHDRKTKFIAARYNLQFVLEEVCFECEIPISGLDRTMLKTGLSDKFLSMTN